MRHGEMWDHSQLRVVFSHWNSDPCCLEDCFQVCLKLIGDFFFPGLMWQKSLTHTNVFGRPLWILSIYYILSNQLNSYRKIALTSVSVKLDSEFAFEVSHPLSFNQLICSLTYFSHVGSSQKQLISLWYNPQLGLPFGGQMHMASRGKNGSDKVQFWNNLAILTF